MMARYESFTFKVDANERKMLSALAESLQRSRADTIRLLVREALAAGLPPLRESIAARLRAQMTEGEKDGNDAQT